MSKIVLPFPYFKHQLLFWREETLCLPELVEGIISGLRQAQSDKVISGNLGLRQAQSDKFFVQLFTIRRRILSLITHHLSLLSLVFCLLSHGSVAQADFSKGTWLKIGITQTGVHKINASELQKAGLKASIRSESIRLFGAKNGILPQRNDSQEDFSLKEIPIEINDTDGDFKATDYFLFYGVSPHQAITNNVEKRFLYEVNPYSDTAYYYLQIADLKGLRMVDYQQNMAENSTPITTFDDVVYYGKESINLLQSGREWYSDFFTNKFSFSATIEGIISTEPIVFSSAVVGTVTAEQKLGVWLNGQAALTHTLHPTGYQAGHPYYRYNRRGEYDSQHTTLAGITSPIQVSYDFGAALPSPSGAYLDYFTIQSKRILQFYSKQTLVRNFSLKQGLDFKFIVKNYSTGFCWRVTDELAPQRVTVNQGNEANFIVSSADSSETFVFFSEQNALAVDKIRLIKIIPISFDKVPNLLLVTPPAFYEQASRLAEFREKNDKLITKVVTTEAVYATFSGGKPDPSAIRNLAKMFWQKDSATFRYLLLFGDATFDYRNRNKSTEFLSFNSVPTYESRESLEPIYSFSSDDYFGFLEATEGDWQEGNRNGSFWDDSVADEYTLDIGVGRLPVRNVLQARQVVDKLIFYANSAKTSGSWRTKVAFVADDEDGNLHHRDAVNLATIAQNTNKNLLTEKLLLGAFPQIGTANGDRSPQAVAALNKAVEEGSLLINYNGHGSEDGWTDEKLLTIEQLIKWRNLTNLPVFLTATCEFGRYDNPNVVSGAELALLNPQGGAIALLTTTRPVYASSNFLLNEAFYQSITPAARLGDIMQKTKNASVSGVLNRNFSLLGDPSMAIALPPNEVKIKTINGQSPENSILKALDKVVIQGEVTNPKLSEGTVEVILFDKPAKLKTLASASTGAMAYEQVQNVLFRGKVALQKGQFACQFVVPKDIDYQIGQGSMYFYAVSTDSLLDATGSFQEFYVGGSSSLFEVDTTPPKVSLQIDETNTLYATIEDESGINISEASIGHELLITLNDTLEIIGNNYYMSTDGYQKGKLIYSFGELKEGNYTVRLKVWDTHNNSTIEALDFVVKPTQWLIEANVVYPNPTNSTAFFSLKHSGANKDLEISLLFFDEFGRDSYHHTDYCYYCSENIEIPIDLSMAFNTNGIKFYTIFLKDILTNQQIRASGKIMFWK